MNWIFVPPWSVRLIAGLVVLLVALGVVRRWREGRGGVPLVLRTICIALLLFVLLNPQSLLPRQRSTKPKLMVLLDTSASMATRDTGEDSRLQTVLRTLNPSTLATLNKEFDLDIRGFDRDLRHAEIAQFTNSPRGDASDIGRAVMSAVSELSETKAQAGVLVISDGRATAVGANDAAELALARSVPLWTWTVGGAVPQRDLWVETGSSEALAFSGADVELSATLHAKGYANRSFKMELLADDRVIETREVVPDTNGTARVLIQVKAPAAGEKRYVFRTPLQPDESETANNERAVFLRAVGEKVRVLVAEGQPYWDTKFLVQSLKRNTNVDLTAVYRLNPQRFVAIISTGGNETRSEQDLFPRTADAMDRFDVIVLGREAESFFDNGTETLLTDFVAKRGGSLLFARGKAYGGRFQALAKFEPVAWGNGVASEVKLRPTEAGRDNPIFDLGASGTLEDLLERLPAVEHASVTLGEKPLAVVLADSAQPDGPVLVSYQRYGHGKAMSLNAGGLWRWSFRELGQDESEAAYQRFWVSLLQWLLGGGQFLPGSDVSLTSARRYYTSEQPMQFLIGTRELDRAVYQPRLIIASGTNVTEVEPRARGGSFVAEAGPFAPGTYRVTLKNNIGKPAELSQLIEVVDASAEKQELSADPDLMRAIAEKSGGSVIGPNDVIRMPEIVKRWEAARELSHRQQSVWDRWWLMGAMLGLLGMEWWLRRREGLL